MDIIVVSIGALAKNPLWNERVPMRTSHATTTVIRTTESGGAKGGKKPVVILVDPSLPGNILDARLDERAGMKASEVTHVFLTSWRPIHRRGLEHFSHATWWMSEAEIEAAGDALSKAERHVEVSARPLIAKEKALLEKVVAAPDQLAEGVDLFPLNGYTPGQAGLLLSEATRTTIVAGDAVPTGGHFLAAQVLQDAFDLEKAKESLSEMYEVADVVIPGHDNLFITPRVTG